MNRTKIRSVAIRVALLLLFVALFVWFFMNHKDEFSILTTIPIVLIIAIALCQLAVVLTNVVFQVVLLKIYRVDMSWLDSFVVIVKSSVINFFGFLQGGTGYRAYYIKKHYGIDYKRFGLLFTANYLVVFSLFAFFGLVGSLLQTIQSGHTANYGVVAFFAAATIGLLIMMFVSPSRIPGRGSFSTKLRGALSEWDNITSNKRRVAVLFLIAAVQYLATAGAFYLELKAIHAETTIAGLMVYSAIAGFSILVALTPAAIGFRETLLIFARQSLGVSVSVIILSATVDRITYAVLLLLLTIVTQRYVINKIRPLLDRRKPHVNPTN